MTAGPSTTRARTRPRTRHGRRRVAQENRRGRVRASLVFVVCLLSLGACAPTIAPPGSRVETPMLAEDHILTADGLRLPLRVWRGAGPPKAVILGMHGFNDYSKSFERPAKAWVAEGFAVYVEPLPSPSVLSDRERAHPALT